jgi:hypothetical protein
MCISEKEFTVYCLQFTVLFHPDIVKIPTMYFSLENMSFVIFTCGYN